MSHPIASTATASASIVSRRGALIVVEGLDRSGKSTQCRMLAEALKKKTGGKAELVRFPDRSTPIGKLIDSYLAQSQDLDDRAIHLLFSANRWEAIPRLKSLLLSGNSLVLDRYAYSGVAFSAAKGLPLPWLLPPDAGLPRPDLVFFLDLSPEDARGRPGFGGERYEVEEMQATVRGVFHELGKRERDTGRWKVLDASNSIDNIHSDMLAAAEEIVRECGDGRPLAEDLFREALAS